MILILNQQKTYDFESLATKFIDSHGPTFTNKSKYGAKKYFESDDSG